MSGLFIKANETITITIFIAKDKNGNSMFNILEEELLDKGVSKEEIKKEEIIFRKPSYRDNVQILNKAVTVQGDSVHVDPMLLRYNRFCTLLKSWTFKDEDGNEIPANARYINDINTDLANTILDELDKYS